MWAGGGHRAEVTSAQTLPESVTEAAASLRFSLGWTSTEADVAALLAALPGAVARARAALP